MREKTPVIRLRAEDCIQCHACETACALGRGLEPGMRWRRAGGRFEGRYPGAKLISFSLSCLHCVDPACGAACPVGAIVKGPDGVVAVDRNLCVGCQACRAVCPVDAPRFGADGTMQKCDLCLACVPVGEGEPFCVSACPTHALERCLLTAEEKRREEAKQTALWGNGDGDGGL